jgi:cephalosporin-C deacetylase-like acetyl esterase
MRRNIEFKADGVTLRGWLYKPNKGKKPFPIVAMAHGFSGIKEMGLDLYAEVFAKAGLAVLVYDNRCLGSSGGQPRQDIDPTMQLRDYRSAITFAQQQPECDSKRIGLWGTSYTGGTVCAVAALDRRVKAVVSQVPFMNGHKNLQQFLPIGSVQAFHEMLDEDRIRRVSGKKSAYVKMCSLDPNEPHVFPGEETYNYIHQYVDADPKCTWENRVTVRSLEYMLEYDVTGYMKMISPTPLMMIVSETDTTTPSDIALELYHMVQGPKDLKVISSNHYGAYTEKFNETSAAAKDWFVRYL